MLWDSLMALMFILRSMIYLSTSMGFSTFRLSVTCLKWIFFCDPGAVIKFSVYEPIRY